MDYKEKYEKALERAREYKDYGYMMINVSLDNIFPELKESEDEKIRKALIDVLTKNVGNGIEKYGVKLDVALAWLEKLKVFTEHGDGLYYFINNGFTYVSNPTLDNISWLEKQGEQKPQGKTALEAIKEEKIDNSNKVEPKFKVGDWVIWENKYYKVNYNGCGYELIDQNNLSTSLEYGTVDNYAHLWSIQDARNGDVLVDKFSKDTVLILFKGITKGWILAHCGWSSYELSVREEGFGYGNVDNTKYVPATKEQRDFLFKKIKESGYEWNAEKKELIKIEENKGKWSIEDFKPFIMVLGRDGIGSRWVIHFYSNYNADNKDYPYRCIDHCFAQCIPYNEETAHLLGTTDDAPEKYKTW